MATLKEIKRKGGRSAFQIEIKSAGRRVWLSLGSRYARNEAAEIANNAERIAAAQAAGRPLDRRAQAWLDAAPEDLKERLNRAGLIEFIRVPTLGEIWGEYWEAEYYELKPSTQSSKRQARRRFFDFFKESTPFDKLTKRDALKFAATMDGATAEATRAGVIRDVRRVFNWAKESELIDRNPFDGIRRGSFKNKAREYYVSPEDFEKMLDACPGGRAVRLVFSRAKRFATGFPTGRLFFCAEG